MFKKETDETIRNMDDPTSQKNVDRGAENQRRGMPMTKSLSQYRKESNSEV